MWKLINITLRHLILGARVNVYRKIWGMKIGAGTLVSLKAKLDKTRPELLIIGKDTYIAFGASILTHDMSRSVAKEVQVGDRCFIGANAIILPGVKIGDEVLVAAGAVVTKSIPSKTLVGGNPAKILRSGLNLGKLGIEQ